MGVVQAAEPDDEVIEVFIPDKVAVRPALSAAERDFYEQNPTASMLAEMYWREKKRADALAIVMGKVTKGEITRDDLPPGVWVEIKF